MNIDIGAAVDTFVLLLPLYLIWVNIRLMLFRSLLDDLMKEEHEWRVSNLYTDKVMRRVFSDPEINPYLYSYMRMDSIGWNKWPWKVWLSKSDIKESIKPVEEYYPKLAEQPKPEEEQPCSK